MTQRVAIVTGAARGIGAATAKRLASDGFAVGVVDLDAASGAPVVDAIIEAGGKAIAIGADVSDEDKVDAAVAEVTERLGAPTALVNNAGVLRDNLMFKMTVDDWDTVLGVHLRGAFLMSKAVQSHMVEAKWGRIVNLSSTSALGNRGQVNYSAAKAGMQGFTKTLAIELGRFGVTANAVAPGFIVTEMTKITAERMGVSFEDMQTRAATQIPVAASASRRTSRTRSRSWPATTPVSCPARSSTWQAARRTERTQAGANGVAAPDSHQRRNDRLDQVRSRLGQRLLELGCQLLGRGRPAGRHAHTGGQRHEVQVRPGQVEQVGRLLARRSVAPTRCSSILRMA